VASPKLGLVDYVTVLIFSSSTSDSIFTSFDLSGGDAKWYCIDNVAIDLFKGDLWDITN